MTVVKLFYKFVTLLKLIAVIIEKTNNKPFVYLSVENSTFEIKGSSYSKSVGEIYQNIILWIDKQLPDFKGVLNCVFYFDMMNTVSNKCLMEIFSKFSYYIDHGKELNITWYYDEDDEDIMEIAESISKLYKIPIEIKETKKRGQVPE